MKNGRQKKTNQNKDTRIKVNLLTDTKYRNK